MDRNNITIHLEGLDLAGKSTISRLLASRLDAPVRHNSLLEYNALHKEAEIHRKNKSLDDEALSWLYYACMLIEIDQYREPDGPRVQDSTILLRTLAYNKAKGREEIVQAAEGKLAAHPRFSLSVFFTANDEVRLKRLEGRTSRGNDNPEDFLVRDDPELFHAMENHLRLYCVEYFDAVCFDTSNLEDEGAKEAIVEQIIDMTKE